MNITANYTRENVRHEALSDTERVVTILKWTYGLVPIVAGVDKFLHLLADWNKYLAPPIARLLPVSPEVFMSGVGIVEILAGVLVLIKPRIGSLVVSLWLLGIVLNLLVGGTYLDVAVRDAVMAIGAFSLYLLTRGREQ